MGKRPLTPCLFPSARGDINPEPGTRGSLHWESTGRHGSIVRDEPPLGWWVTQRVVVPSKIGLFTIPLSASLACMTPQWTVPTLHGRKVSLSMSNTPVAPRTKDTRGKRTRKLGTRGKGGVVKGRRPPSRSHPRQTFLSSIDSLRYRPQISIHSRVISVRGEIDTDTSVVSA